MSTEEQKEDPHGELVPQPHGGALRTGGKPGNAGGGGNRPSQRAKLMAGKVMETVMERLDEMASGRVEVELKGTCPECGYEGQGETFTARAYQDFLLKLMDKVAPHQGEFDQPIDTKLVERLGRVVAFAIRDIEPEMQDDILDYVKSTWAAMVSEYNEKVANIHDGND